MPRAAPSSKTEAERKAYKLAHQAKLRAKRILEGICTVCAKRPCGISKAYCDECRGAIAERNRERYSNNKEKHAAGVRAWQEKMKAEGRWKDHVRGRVLSKYGLTLEQYREMQAAQGNRCAICGDLPRTRTKRDLVVDHDHETNKVRSLLCHICNFGLGAFLDRAALLRAAADYIDRWAIEHFGLSAQEQPKPKRKV